LSDTPHFRGLPSSAVPQEMNSQQTSTWIDFPPNSSTLRLKLKCYSGVNGKSSVARKAAVLPTII
jgi:hypothetical protein